VDRLTGIDASFLYFETRTQLLHVCGLIVLDTTSMPEPYSFERLRERMGETVGRNPQFRKRLHNPLLNVDHPVWVDDHDFDIENHVRRTTVPSPGTRDQLADVCADIAAQMLDRTRPLWEFWVIEGLPDGQLAVMTKMHHATVDGVSGANLIGDLCSLAPDAAPTATTHAAPEPHPRDRDIIVDGLRTVVTRPVKLAALAGRSFPVLPSWVQRSREGNAMAAPFTAPRTSFNGAITGHRSIAFTSLDLDAVKEVKNAFGTTVNDVVLAVCAGALRRYLIERDELPAASLVGMVPVSVHGKTSGRGANHVSGLFTHLRTDIADPVERLLAIGSKNKVAKAHQQTIDATMLQDWAQFAMPNTFGMAVRVYSRLRLADRHPVVHNLVISNVPGPPIPIYFAGAKIVHFHPFGPVFHGAGLNITVVSQNGALDVGLIACREQAPELWELADDLPAALEDLLTAARAMADTVTESVSAQ
jgi:WS/DGAT/MGAT family acyltransferase